MRQMPTQNLYTTILRSPTLPNLSEPSIHAMVATTIGQTITRQLLPADIHPTGTIAPDRVSTPA